MTRLEELAERLHTGARAIREGWIDATIAELVTGAVKSMHQEAVARRVLDRHREVRAAREARGLCLDCGRRQAMPGRKWCALCLLRVRVQVARRRGKMPHVRHPVPREKAPLGIYPGPGTMPSGEGEACVPEEEERTS